MSFINGLSDFTVSISFQPSSTATQRFCCDQIWLPWIGTATRIPCCQTKQLPQLARVFKRLADRLQGVVSDTTTITITPEYNFGRPQPRIGGLSVAETEGLDSPGLKRPGALQKPGRPGSVLLTRYDKDIPGIYLSYVPAQ